jgi:hypothetical protein
MSERPANPPASSEAPAAPFVARAAAAFPPDAPVRFAVAALRAGEPLATVMVGMAENLAMQIALLAGVGADPPLTAYRLTKLIADGVQRALAGVAAAERAAAPSGTPQ